MDQSSIPLGFLAGSIASGSHCIFTYPRRDENLLQSLARFLSAGLQVGEVCICLADDDTCRELTDRLAVAGTENSLIIRSASEIYSPRGRWDADALRGFLMDALVEARRRGKQARSFTDFGSVPWSKTARFKLLEFEARMSLDCPMTIAMCGYHSGSVGRSWLAQARSAHPFIANNHSIRRNPSCVEPTRFLSGLYSCRRVSKEYSLVSGMEAALQADFEEVAARTPLTGSEIEALRGFLGEMFVHLIASVPAASDTTLPHIHVAFAPEFDKLRITIRKHVFAHKRDYTDPAFLRQHLQSHRAMSDGAVDGMDVESWRGEAVVTITKRYKPPFRALG